MAWAHKLQIGLGLYYRSILGLGLGSLQPTMNPYGSLVVKQAENLKKSTCIEHWRGELLRRVLPRLKGCFP